MGYAVNILGFGPPKGVLLQKKKFFIFRDIFMRSRNLGIADLAIMDFSKILKISNERSDLKMDHMSEFVSDFAHSEI